MRTYNLLCSVIIGTMFFSHLVFWVLKNVNTGQMVCIYLACIVASAAVWDILIKLVTEKK
jgi:hypothetical protein